MAEATSGLFHHHPGFPVDGDIQVLIRFFYNGFPVPADVFTYSNSVTVAAFRISTILWTPLCPCHVHL